MACTAMHFIWYLKQIIVFQLTVEICFYNKKAKLILFLRVLARFIRFLAIVLVPLNYEVVIISPTRSLTSACIMMPTEVLVLLSTLHIRLTIVILD